MKKVSIGGQAVIDCELWWREIECIIQLLESKSGEIVYKKTKLIDKDINFFKKPFIRGVIMLFESLVIGVKELTFCCKSIRRRWTTSITNKEAILTTVVSLAFRNQDCL